MTHFQFILLMCNTVVAFPEHFLKSVSVIDVNRISVFLIPKRIYLNATEYLF